MPWGETRGTCFAQKHCASAGLERERRGGEGRLGRAGDRQLPRQTAKSPGDENRTVCVPLLNLSSYLTAVLKINK